MDDNFSLLMPTSQAARLCGVSVRTWYTWDQLGKIPKPIHIGRKLFWRRSELLSWIDADCPRRQDWIFREKLKNLENPA